HGVFGGLYLPHQRAAVYRELIAAETFLGDGTPNADRGDFDLDGDEDALLENASWSAWIGSRGARLWAFDDRRQGWNYGDTLARRPEYYHRRFAEAAVGVASGKTIHGAVRVKEPGLAALIENYDTRGRESFLDRWRDGGGDHD